jgi:hypothetical protein
MTIAEVVHEMRNHLKERTAPQDELIPAGHWRELLRGDWSFDRFKLAVQKQPDGRELWKEYIATRVQRLELYKQALRLASAEGRSVWQEAKLWGRQIETTSLRAWGIWPNRKRVDGRRLHQAAKRNMSIREWATAGGCNVSNIYTWMRRGKLASMVVLGMRERDVGFGTEYYIKKVVRRAD